MTAAEFLTYYSVLGEEAEVEIPRQEVEVEASAEEMEIPLGKAVLPAHLFPVYWPRLLFAAVLQL